MAQVGPSGAIENPVPSQSASTIEAPSLASRLAHSLAVIAKPFRGHRDNDIKSPKSSGPNLIGPGGEIISDSDYQARMAEEESRRVKQPRTQSGDSTLRRHLEGEVARATTETAGFSDAKVEHSAELAAFAQRNKRPTIDQVIGNFPTAGSNQIDSKTAAEMFNKAAENARRDLEKLEKAAEKKQEN